MHISIQKEKFADAVSRAEKVTGKNMSLQILQAVLLIAKGKTLTVRSTNLDLGIEITLPAKVEKEGSVAVPGSILSSVLVNTIGAATLSLKKDQGALVVKTEKAVSKIKTYPTGEFPSFPEVKKGASFTVPTKKLGSGLRSVWYSAATSSMKPELASVFIYTDGKNLVFVATDSFRLAEKHTQVGNIDDLESLLIPTRNVGEIIRNLEAENEEATLTIDESQLQLTVGNTTITSRVIDGTFPDYKQIVPKEFVAEATILKEDLASTLKLGAVFANKFNQITFVVQPKKKHFAVKTHNTEVGESAIPLEGALTGDDIEIGFNYKYIVDSFQSITADSVVLRFSGEGKPLVIQAVGDKSFTYLVMPMNR